MISRTSDKLAAVLSDPKVQAYCADQQEESLIDVDMFNRLDVYADREMAREHHYFVPNGDNTSILCRRDGVDPERIQESTFCFTAPLNGFSMMPYGHYTELNKSEVYVPSAHQYVVLADTGANNLLAVQQAISNFHVMARLRLPEGTLKPLVPLRIDEADALCISTPISTPRTRMLPGDEPLALSYEQDPNGIVSEYLARRDHVVLIDNQVDVYLASHAKEAGSYDLHGGVCGPILRQGQIVRVEVGFRIVPAGRMFTMRTDLKSVVIIHDDIAATMAFNDADAEGKEAEGKKRTISVSSAGPSGLLVQQPSLVVRAPRRPKNFVQPVKAMSELPFPPL